MKISPRKLQIDSLMLQLTNYQDNRKRTNVNYETRVLPNSTLFPPLTSMKIFFRELTAEMKETAKFSRHETIRTQTKGEEKSPRPAIHKT